MAADLTGAIPTLLVGGGTYVGGVVTGLFAKSFERWWGNRSERRRLRNALYEELGMNFQNMFLHTLTLHSPPADSWIGSQFAVQEWEHREVYDQALKTQPILFHEVREAKLMSQFYMALERLKVSTPEQQMEGIRVIYNWIIAEVKKGKLSRGTLYDTDPSPDSPFLHPLRVFLRRRYSKVTHRNVPKDGRGHLFGPSTTFRQELNAVWRGLPGESMDHELDSIPGRNPLGKRIV